MGTLHITLFGGVRIQHSGRPDGQKITHTIQGLLAYLLLQRHRTHPRDVLADLFWGDVDPERARGCLSTALWRLRRALEPEGVPCGTYLIGAHGGEIGFNTQSPHWLDIAIFEEKARPVLRRPIEEISPGEAQALEESLPLYTGELLEGFYDDWAIREREHFRSIYLDCLACLMRYARQNGLYDKGLSFGRLILQLEPLREEIHREVMALYAASGQRALALQQFEICRKILKTELDIQPMEETHQAYLQVVMGDPVAAGDLLDAGTVVAGGILPAAHLSGLQVALQQLRHAADLATQVHEQILHSIRSLEASAEKKEK